MGIFYILLLVPMMIPLISIKERPVSNKKKHTAAITFFFLLLTVMIMLRHEGVGNDTRNYIYYFDVYSKLDWHEIKYQSLDIGYAYLNKLVSLISLDPQVFLAVSGLAVSAMIYPTYRRLCTDAPFTVVLFCNMSTFVMMFSGIRQMLAIAAGFLAYEFTRRKRLIPFFLAVVLALSFHASAFILIFMYPIYHARITRNWLYPVVPALGLIFVFNEQIFSALGSIVARYTEYDTTISSTGAYTMLVLFGIFAVVAFLIPDQSRLDGETIGLRNFLLLALAIQMFAPLHTLAMRMNYYYIIFIPLLLPRIIERRSLRWNRIAVVGRYMMVAFFLLYFFVNARGGGGLHVFPYHFFWENI